MKFIEIKDKDKYIKFTRNHEKSHFLQSYEWGMFCKSAKGQIPKYVGMEDEDGNLVASALILLKMTPLGFSYGYAPRGFLIDYKNKEHIKEFTSMLKKYMKDEKIIYIKFDPDIKYQCIDEDGKMIDGENNYELYDYMRVLGYKHTGFYKLYEGNQPRYTFRTNLKQDFESIEASWHKSFTKSVKRSYQYNLEIDNDKNVEVFYNLMKVNSMKDGFDPHSLEYYQKFCDALSSEDSLKFFNVSIRPKEILSDIDENLKSLNEQLEKSKKNEADIKNKIARYEKEKDIFSKIKEEKLCVCSLICTYTGNRAWSLFIGSDDLANFTFAVARSYYEAMKDAHESGYEFFDLFGTPGDPHTTYKNLANLHDFKRKFGGEYVEFIGEFDLVNKPILYKVLPLMLKVYRKLRR